MYISIIMSNNILLNRVIHKYFIDWMYV